MQLYIFKSSESNSNISESNHVGYSVCVGVYQGDLYTTGDDSDLIYVHTRVRVGPTSHKSYSITNWCE